MEYDGIGGMEWNGMAWHGIAWNSMATVRERGGGGGEMR